MISFGRADLIAKMREGLLRDLTSRDFMGRRLHKKFGSSICHLLSALSFIAVKKSSSQIGSEPRMTSAANGLEGPSRPHGFLLKKDTMQSFENHVLYTKK